MYFTKILRSFIITFILVCFSIILFFTVIQPFFIMEVLSITDNTELLRYYSGKERLREVNTHKTLSKKFDHISIAEDSILIYFKGLSRGFLSVKTGKQIIPAIYSHAWQYSENKAFVTNEKNQFGIINRAGQLIMPFKYQFVANVASLIEDQVYSFSNGKAIFTDAKNFGVIDSTGKELIAPVYSQIKLEPKGFYSVLKDDRWGLYDSKFLKVLNNEYGSISVLQSGILIEKDGQEILLSMDAKSIISETVYSDIFPLQFITSESESNYTSGSADESDYESYDESDAEKVFTPRLCSGFTVVRKEQGVGLLNADKKLIIQCLYSEIMAISESLFRCKLKDESYVLIDQSGQIVIPEHTDDL